MTVAFLFAEKLKGVLKVITENVTQKGSKKAPVLAAILAAVGMLAFYFGVLSLTQSFSYALHHLGDIWPWMAALIIGFAIEVGLFVYMSRELKRRRSSTALLATTGSVSACSMILCCAPRLADLVPLLGVSTAAFFLASYLKLFLLMGAVFNAIGIALMLRTIQKYELYDKTGGTLHKILKYNMDRISKAAVGVGSVALVVVLLVSLFGGGSGGGMYRSDGNLVPNVRSGTVTFNITYKIPQTGKDFHLWLPYLTSNDYQNVTDVKVEGNFDYQGVYREAANGNIILYADWNSGQDTANLIYSVKISRQEILMKDFPKSEAPIPADIMAKYLLPTSLGPITGDVKQTALQITAGKTTVLDKAMAIYDYIVENGQRDPNVQGCGIGDVESLLKNLKGKCTDLSSVFVALSRSVGVPAREILGTRISKDGDITGAYHCRAEFYEPGYGWVPVDPSDVLKYKLTANTTLSDPKTAAIRQYLFGAQSESYIDFYTGRDLVLNPPQGGGTLTYLMYPYGELDGQPLPFVDPDQPVYQEGLKYTVTFKQIVGSTSRFLPW